MAYSTYVAEPKLYSVESRGMSIFNISPEIDLRIVDLSGIPVRVKIDAKLKYIYFKTGLKTPKEVKEEFSKRYLLLFQTMMEKFFKDDAFIYGIYKEERFFVYDIYTNSNWFTFYDLTRIENEYKYCDLGFELLHSITKEKHLTTLSALKIFSDIIEKNPEKQRKLYILPYYDLVSATGYSFTPSVPHSLNLEVSDVEEKIYGAYVAPAAPAVVAPSTKKNINVNVEEGKDKYSLFDEITELSKLEREKVFNQAKANISSYIERKKYQLTSEEKNCVLLISYLWGLWSHLNLRKKIVEFLSNKNNYIFLRELNMNNNRNYSYLMLALWYRYNSKNLDRLSIQSRKVLSANFVYKILEEEFTYFDRCFDIILKETMVKINANAS